MSLWVCAEHGLYGGQVFCPKCGASGSYATLSSAASGTEAGTGETPLRLDPKGDGPVPERQAPNLSKHIGSE